MLYFAILEGNIFKIYQPGPDKKVHMDFETTRRNLIQKDLSRTTRNIFILVVLTLISLALFYESCQSMM